MSTPITCPICLEDIDGEATDKHTLDCQHAFHASCLLKWTLQGNGTSCPTCRASTTTRTTGLGFMTSSARASYLRRTLARRKNAPPDLLRLVDQLRRAEAQKKEARRKDAAERRENRDALRRVRRTRTAYWRASRRENEARRLLGCYSSLDFPLPGLAPGW